MKQFCFDWGQGGFILGLILSPDVKDWPPDRQGVPLKDQKPGAWTIQLLLLLPLKWTLVPPC